MRNFTGTGVKQNHNSTVERIFHEIIFDEVHIEFNCYAKHNPKKIEKTEYKKTGFSGDQMFRQPPA